MLLEQVDALLDSTPKMRIENEETTETSSPNPSSPVAEPFKLDLKPLPDTMKYRFLGPAKSLPVIIASNLGDAQEQIFDVLKEHKEAIRWSIRDNKGISLLVIL